VTRRSRPLPLAAYGVLTGLLAPLAGPALRGRARRGKEDAARLRERLGHASRQRPPGAVAWLHGASVGESLSLLPLIERMRAERPYVTILVTSGTVTSATLLARRLPEGVIHQYAPVDTPGAVQRFLDHWRPDLAVFAESEIWPNLIWQTKASGAKMALVSAKISEATRRGWLRWRVTIRSILACYDLVLAQDERSERRLEDLGRTPDGVADLKYGAAPLPYDDDGLDQMRSHTGRRMVLLAASTHPGEEVLVMDAFVRSAAADHALLIIAPRHPERGPDIVEMANRRGLAPALRSEGEPPGTARVYVADTLGEVGLWLRLARVAVIGGSLVPGVGGHNPLEAARLGCPAASGRYVDNWQSAYDDLVDAQGVEMISGPDDLANLFEWTDNALVAMAERATERVTQRDGEARAGLSRILDLCP
jgi:3-deoxy-D-manno-octulosonic-acid transferase